MVLLVTNRDDLTADWLVIELERRGVAFVRFNTEDYPETIAFNWSLADGLLGIGGSTLRVGDITAVWWRRPLMPVLEPSRPEREVGWAVGEARAALEGFWQSLDAHWVNSPSANAAAENKLHQLRLASSIGFDVPATLVTNQPDAVRLFASSRPRLVCKAISDGRVPTGGTDRVFFTTTVDHAELEDLDDLGPEPYMFQELVEKAYDVRVTIIGDNVYACRILSQCVEDAAIDWRRGDLPSLEHEIEALPPAVEQACVALTRTLHLRFAAIDLARRPDGGYSFFEVNPNGQWAWVEQLCGLPLRRALVDELLSEAR